MRAYNALKRIEIPQLRIRRRNLAHKLLVQTRCPDDLSIKEREQMWQLYSEMYLHVDRYEFLFDLNQKNTVYMAYDKQTKQLKGFSTALVYTTKLKDQKYSILYSGDTIIHPDYWGSKALHKAMMKTAIQYKLKYPQQPLYWHLISSGNRTYMAMARNCPSYFPAYNQETPKVISELIDHISSSQFGASYNKKTQVIEMNRPKAIFRPELAPFDRKTRSLPEISFFMQKNPGYHKGDELSCLAEIDSKMFVHFLKRNIYKKINRFSLQQS